MFQRIRSALIVALSVALVACQTPPTSQGPAEVPQNPTVATVDTPMPEAPPALPPEPECPEPEPVPVQVCPPPPKPIVCPKCPESRLDGKMLLGGEEKVYLDPPGVTYTARVDSGAAGTSIHATNIVSFERDGEPWLRFDIENSDGEPITLERQIERRVKVRQVELDELSRRYKVIMSLTIGSRTEQIEVSLNDRSDMEHPVLIGRNFLRNNAIVDVSQEFIAK